MQSSAWGRQLKSGRADHFPGWVNDPVNPWVNDFGNQQPSAPGSSSATTCITRTVCAGCGTPCAWPPTSSTLMPAGTFPTAVPPRPMSCWPARHPGPMDKPNGAHSPSRLRHLQSRAGLRLHGGRGPAMPGEGHRRPLGGRLVGNASRHQGQHQRQRHYDWQKGIRMGERVIAAPSSRRSPVNGTGRDPLIRPAVAGAGWPPRRRGPPGPTAAPPGACR